MEETLEVVETLVEEEAMVMEVVAAEGVMEGVMVDIVGLEVMVAAMALILVIVVEEVNRRLAKDIIETFCERRNKTLIFVSHYKDEYPSVINRELFLKRIS